MVEIGEETENGIVLLSGEPLEMGGAVKIVLFDNTGSITERPPTRTVIIVLETISRKEEVVIIISGHVKEH